MRLIAPMKKLLLEFTHSHIPVLLREPASLYLQDKKKEKRAKGDPERTYMVNSHGC